MQRHEPSPPDAHHGIWLIALGVIHLGALIAIVGLAPGGGGHVLVQVPLSLYFVYLGGAYLRTRVIVDGAGLRVLGHYRFAQQSARWEDVSGLRVDPPGGPRAIHVDLVSGRTLRLPPLDDAASAP